jgi:hypothetical protein
MGLGLYARMVYNPRHRLNRHQFIAELHETPLFYIETNKTEIIELILSTKKL